jgi:tRNA-dihydrouridine synthase
VKQQAEWALEYAKKLCEEHGESVAMRELRGIIPHFFSGFPGYKKVRVQIASSLTTMDQLEKILEGIKSREHC